jgi:hypothetical protein
LFEVFDTACGRPAFLTSEPHMLELAIVYYMSKSIGEIALAKGRIRFGYMALLWLLWFGGEFFGAVVGAVIFSSGGEEPPMLLIYGCGLAGAIAGAVATFVLVNSLPSLKSEDDYSRNRPAYERDLLNERSRLNDYGRKDAPQMSLEERYKL